MAVVIVEHTFDPPLNLDEIGATIRDVSVCLPTYDVGWINSFFSRDGSRGVCVYQAVDAESVRRTYRAAGVAFDSVWTARPFEKAGATME